ncbi:hypothetical protein KAR48_01445 [bacterium]|nr:hypothetical protein [bacterium]
MLRKNKYNMLCFVMLIFLSILFMSCSEDVQIKSEENILEYNYNGSSQLGQQFRSVMKNISVQKLLLDLSHNPQSEKYLLTALNDTNITIDQLIRLGLIHKKSEKYQLSFSLLTHNDMKLIYSAAEKEGSILAQELLEYKSDIRELLSIHDMPHVDWQAMAYFILGCVSLDWDGLNLMEEKGYLYVSSSDTYFPTAEQPTPKKNVRELYWGSHNNHDDITVTTFGDHYALPRNGLPDILWQFDTDVNNPLGSQLTEAARQSLRNITGIIMLEFRDGSKSISQLIKSTGFDENVVESNLDLLLGLNYVNETSGKYHAIIPILTERDKQMVVKLRLIGRKVMTKWLADRYGVFCEKIADLSPNQYGIKLDKSFYMIWHYIFGVANRELVKEGLFADPYDMPQGFKGFIPAVYKLSVVQSEL